MLNDLYKAKKLETKRPARLFDVMYGKNSPALSLVALVNFTKRFLSTVKTSHRNTEPAD